MYTTISSVSMAPNQHALPGVNVTSEPSTAVVNDVNLTSEPSTAVVNDNGESCITGIWDASEVSHHLQVISGTGVMQGMLTGVTDTGHACFYGTLDTVQAPE